MKVSPFSKSETRFVNPIPIYLKHLGEEESEEQVIILDTPGSEDTESNEVDLSNGLGILKAIHGTKSVIPVIL